MILQLSRTACRSGLTRSCLAAVKRKRQLCMCVCLFVSLPPLPHHIRLISHHSRFKTLISGQQSSRVEEKTNQLQQWTDHWYRQTHADTVSPLSIWWESCCRSRDSTRPVSAHSIADSRATEASRYCWCGADAQPKWVDYGLSPWWYWDHWESADQRRNDA